MAERNQPLAPLVYGLRSIDGRSILAHDPAGPGRIVEVFGDLPTARHVAVLVPGNAQSLPGYRDGSGGAAVRHAAMALSATLSRTAPSARCAVIAWLGYRCPHGLLAAVRRDAAEAGARDLRRLTWWLPAEARLTLIGHSYGSLVCAMAARGGRVDDLVAVASPGLGIRNLAQLPSSARVWAMRGSADWVRWLPRGRIGPYGHGRQPTDRRFGAHLLDAGSVVGHSGYYEPDSTALRAIAAVVVGRPETRQANAANPSFAVSCT